MDKEFLQRYTITLRDFGVRLGQKVEALTGWTLKDMWRIVKYGISGITGGVLQVLFLYIFVDRFGLWYLQGVVFAFLVSLVVVFFLQKFWTFQDYSVESLRRQSFLYTVIAVVALGLNVLLMYVFVDVFHFWHIVAQCIVVGAVGTLTFLMNKTFTFSGKADIQ